MSDEKELIDQPIKPKSQIVIDGDLSPERTQALVALAREEERLDYKECLDFSSSSARNRAKVDIVCDLVSMANTDGGYIVVGVREKGDGTFTIEGVDKHSLSLLKQENIQNWVDSFIDTTLRILVRPNNYDDKRLLILILVYPGRLPAVFKRDGQYQDPAGGRSTTKFRKGELFVRHGSKSERANYEDWLRISEKIREDERRKAFEAEGRHRQITDPLDAIINLLGGTPPSRRALDIMIGTEQDVEDRTAQLLSIQNPIIIRRALRKEFQSIHAFLNEQQNIETREELLENLERNFVSFLKRLFSVWVTSIEYDNYELASSLVELIHKLYSSSNSLSFRSEQEEITPLWVQSKVIYAVYCLGAFTVLREKPQFARLFLDRGNPFDSYWKEKSWFRYILTMLARAKQLEQKSLCALVFDYAKDYSYLIELFGGEEEFRTSLCQFDFLQCLYVLVKTEDIRELYPSFAAFYKHRTEPIIEKIISSHETGSWIPELSSEECANAIDILDRYAAKESGLFHDWDYGVWSSSRISRFLEENKKTDSSQ